MPNVFGRFVDRSVDLFLRHAAGAPGGLVNPGPQAAKGLEGFSPSGPILRCCLA